MQQIRNTPRPGPSQEPHPPRVDTSGITFLTGPPVGSGATSRIHPRVGHRRGRSGRGGIRSGRTVSSRGRCGGSRRRGGSRRGGGRCGGCRRGNRSRRGDGSRRRGAPRRCDRDGGLRERGGRGSGSEPASGEPGRAAHRAAHHRGGRRHHGVHSPVRTHDLLRDGDRGGGRDHHGAAGIPAAGAGTPANHCPTDDAQDMSAKTRTMTPTMMPGIIVGGLKL